MLKSCLAAGLALLACSGLRAEDKPAPPPRILAMEPVTLVQGYNGILKVRGVQLKSTQQVQFADAPNIKVEIGGHTDNVGDDAGNQRLSKSRADAVFEYLLAHGVRADRMLTMGYGETRPIDTNMTDAGKLANRRVEFVIMDNGLNQR